MKFALWRRLVAEGVGTMLLVAAIVGSGIMGERLAGGNVAVALLANSLATGFALAALIYVFAPISGAHLNPAVTFSLAVSGIFRYREATAYIIVQFASAFAGVAIAHLMFGESLFIASATIRTGPSQWFSESVATFGLVLIVLACMRQRLSAAPTAISAYIAAAYWFTASTSFANPAVTVGRAFTNTFSGIRPSDVAPFIAAELLGALIATLFARAQFGAVDSNRPSI